MITPFHPIDDLPDATALWNAALGAQYPLTEKLFANVTRNPVPGQSGQHFIQRVNRTGQLIGWIGTQINPNGANPTSGALLGIVVHPAYQRQGLGGELLNHVLDYFKSQGVTRVMSGGRYPRIFPGIPVDLPHAQSFMEKQGWLFDQTDYDLFRRLEDYQTPTGLLDRLNADGVRIYAGSQADRAEVLAFNDREFAGWASTYHYVASLGDDQDFLVARDPRRGVVGTLLMVTPQSHPQRVDALWKPLWGANAGGLGEVGVGKEERGRGLGIGLVAAGSEILKARGVGHCNIGFTSLVDFYGKLGYRVWRAYHIAWQTL
jgi:GNAT superfamily N-acetyltransferase